MGKSMTPTFKHDIEKNWNKAINYIPPIGEIIIYDADENNELPRIKLGNGKQNVIDLPFMIKPSYHVEDDELNIL